MRIRTLWVDYSSRPGELMPNIMLAVDQYLEDEDPELWSKEMAKLDDQGVLDYPHREAVLEVDEESIRLMFALPHIRTRVSG